MSALGWRIQAVVGVEGRIRPTSPRAVDDTRTSYAQHRDDVLMTARNELRLECDHDRLHIHVQEYVE